MSKPTYAPQAMELIVDSPDVRVAEITLGPGGDTPAHEHSAVEEVCYCLEGELTCEADGTPTTVLRPGERKRFAAGLHHRLTNRGETSCRFLLVHGVGRFDFVPSAKP